MWNKKCPGLGSTHKPVILLVPSLHQFFLTASDSNRMPSVHKIQGAAAVSASKDNMQVPSHSCTGVSGVQAPPELGSGRQRL